MTDDNISKLLDVNSDESDEDINTRVKKVGQLAPKRTPRASRNVNKPIKYTEIPTHLSPKKTTKVTSQTPTTTQSNIKLKIRRSTDQSHYKVCTSEEKKSPSKSTVINPKNAVKNLETEQSPNKNKNISDGNKTPRRSYRRKKNNNDGSEDEKEEKEEEENYNEIFSPSKTRLQIQTTTPKSSISKSISTTPSTPRSSRRLANKKYCFSEIESSKNDTNKENKVEIDLVKCDEKIKEIIIDSTSMTPKKSSIIGDRRTPRTVKKRVNFDDNVLTPPKTQKKITDDDNDDDKLKTPKRETKRISKSLTPSLRRGNITPSMRKRRENIEKPKTNLQEARSQLHVSAVPSSLPCREKEFNEIFQFLKGKLTDHLSGCYYISGVPGTGKTATVNEVLRCLKKLESRGEIKNFDYIQINGMKLTEPRQAYTQIVKQLTGVTESWEQAHNILDKKFTKSNNKSPMTLLLVDELDLLCNKRQDVVYNLLDWPTKQSSKLVVVTIANTMDLPERVLMGRVTSRLGLTRLSFQPYNFKQLQEIVETRLKQSNAFRSEAIQLVSRKVAAVSGDARRALDICRRATEIAETREANTVLIHDVECALEEMISSPKVRAIKYCSEMEKFFLKSVYHEIMRTGVEEVIFDSVYEQFKALCRIDGFKPPNISQALEICARLGSSRLLICEHSRADILQRILLNVSPDDIRFALEKVQV